MSRSGMLRVVYAGTPEFAKTALEALIGAGYEVPLVLTQPDRPAGRGLKLQPSAVKQCALKHGIEVLEPAGLRLDGKYAQQAQATRDALEALQPDVMVVAAYGLILPQWVLDLPKLGCLNIHASLLPRWRGAAPIHRAIEAGDTHTGVTIMQMDAGLDTGAMLEVAAIEIKPVDTTASLHDRLAVLGGELLLQVLAKLSNGEQLAQAQPEQGVCYAHKIDKAESRINWNDSAVVIERRMRAFDPFPGVTTEFNGQLIKLWHSKVQAISDSGLEKQALSFLPEPGKVMLVDGAGIHVMTGRGMLVVTELQRPGGKRQPAREFLQAVPVKLGDLWR